MNLGSVAMETFLGIYFPALFYIFGHKCHEHDDTEMI